ncbi:MAG: hypothetical protein AAF108_11470 [Planctomycetota bacterium]
MVQRRFVAFAVAVVGSSAGAQPIFDTFGDFSNQAFDALDLPESAVAASKQIVDGDVIITLALSATERPSNPALTNDGAGTYFATPGTNVGVNTEVALWDFNYLIQVEGTNGATPILSDYQFDLFYDFDPSEDTDRNTLSQFDVTALLNFAGSNSTVFVDSQNLISAFLATPSTFITPQAGGFDPNALGEYNFAITVSQPGGFPVETVAIDVAVIPAPASVSLLGGACLLNVRRRR